MDDEELLALYAADHEERQQFLQLRNEFDKMKMRVVIKENEVKRRELVDDLMPPVNSPFIIKTPADYFRAAYIYSRGDSISDRKKAQLYAKKAYSLVLFKQDAFTEQVRNLYQYTNRRLMRATQEPTFEFMQLLAIQMTVLQAQLNLQTWQRKKRAQERELKRLRKCPKCFTCGRQHEGPCLPKYHKPMYTLF